MDDPTLASLIDLDRYPIDRPDSDGYRSVVADAHAGLRGDGCAVIKDLVRPDALARLGDEIRERKHTTHFSTQVINPYFHYHHNPDFPDRHPVNTFIERSSGFIPGDSWEATTATRQLFEHATLARFLACLLYTSDAADD